MPTVKLLLESDQSKSELIEAELFKRPMGERVKAAAKVSMPWFAVALIGALIPMVHFVIVPAALIAIAYLSVREITTPTFYRVSNLKCPHCENPYGENVLPRLPRRFACFKCRITSTVSAN